MKARPILLYILFFILAVIVFLFLLFPQKKVAVSFSHGLTSLSSNVDVNIEKVKLGLPFKLVFENTTLLIDQRTKIVPDSVEVLLNPFVLFNDEKPVAFQADLYQGTVTGSMNVTGVKPFSVSQGRLSASQVKINDFRYKTDLADILLGCEISGEYKQTGVPPNTASGQGTISIRNFSATLKNSLFNLLKLPEVDFTEIKFDFTRSEKRVTISRCIAKGPVINIKLKGRIQVMLPLGNTGLNLAGTVLPDSPYLAKFANKASIRSVVKNISKQGIKFNIKGTLDNPEIGI